MQSEIEQRLVFSCGDGVAEDVERGDAGARTAGGEKGILGNVE
jgi:hypothetical protein